MPHENSSLDQIPFVSEGNIKFSQIYNVINGISRDTSVSTGTNASMSSFAGVTWSDGTIVPATAFFTGTPLSKDVQNHFAGKKLAEEEKEIIIAPGTIPYRAYYYPAATPQYMLPVFEWYKNSFSSSFYSYAELRQAAGQEVAGKTINTIAFKMTSRYAIDRAIQIYIGNSDRVQSASSLDERDVGVLITSLPKPNETYRWVLEAGDAGVWKEISCNHVIDPNGIQGILISCCSNITEQYTSSGKYSFAECSQSNGLCRIAYSDYALRHPVSLIDYGVRMDLKITYK
tara:strand:- start:279 stop:1139 length:861 start_codon:yes stop_codon:yes gene_type:complete